MKAEESLQTALVNYIRAQYPHCRVMHVPMGEKRPSRTNRKGQTYSPEGAKLKRMGACAGFPDLIIYPEKVIENLEVVLRAIRKPPLHLELKAEQGRLSDAQKEWIDWLTYNGHEAKVAYGFDEARQIVDDYLKN